MGGTFVVDNSSSFGTIFTIFSSYESVWMQMIDLYFIFQFVEGRCHGNQLSLGKCYERQLIPLAFFALSFENELQYHCINVCVNSGDDVAISCKDLVNFCLATPEKMELIWERQVRHSFHTCMVRILSCQPRGWIVAIDTRHDIGVIWNSSLSSFSTAPEMCHM